MFVWTTLKFIIMQSIEELFDLEMKEMESSKLISFYEKCRLCLAKPGVKDIFETKNTPDLQQAIHMSTGVRVYRYDNLPQKICKKCYKIIKQAKKLRLLASKNDLQLRTLFDEENNEVSTNTEEANFSNINLTEKKPLLKCENKTVDCLSSKQNEQNSTTGEKATQNNRQSGTVEPIIISVRKDLFEPMIVSSSTKAKIKEQEDKHSPEKKVKLENEIDTWMQHTCSICSKIYETRKKLYLHKRMHNKSITCPLDACGKKFATRGDLEKHIRTHTGAKPYSCDICDKSFSQQVSLKQHKEKVHCSSMF